jgi:ankyrin repeat protein
MTSTEQLFIAVTTGDVETVRQMVATDPPLAHARDKDGVSAILKAAYHRRPPVLEVLLQSTIEPLDIWEAAATGNAARVKALLQSDPTLLNGYATDGFYPLGLAAFFRQQEVATVLLAAGADVNQSARNAMRVRPLHAAAAADHVEIAQMLLERRADPNAAQQMGFRPLHEVALLGRMPMAKLLLEHGADVNARSDDGKTALTFALQGKHEEMARYLRERGGTE